MFGAVLGIRPNGSHHQDTWRNSQCGEIFIVAFIRSSPQYHLCQRYFHFYHSCNSKQSKTLHSLFMLPSAPLNSKMVMMLGGNDFDLNQQGRPSYYESATNLFHIKNKKGFTLDLRLQRKHSPKCCILHQSYTAVR